MTTSDNFVMIRWWEHSQKGVTDRQTDGQTDWTIHRAAWSQLKIWETTSVHKYLLPFNALSTDTWPWQPFWKMPSKCVTSSRLSNVYLSLKKKCHPVLCELPNHLHWVSIQLRGFDKEEWLSCMTCSRLLSDYSNNIKAASQHWCRQVCFSTNIKRFACRGKIQQTL